MIHYISEKFSITTFARAGSTSVLNWCYYGERGQPFSGKEYGYGHPSINGSGVHWYYLKDCNFSTEMLLQQAYSKQNILIIRDPIERFVSAFNFLKNNSHDNLKEKLLSVHIENFIDNLDLYRQNKFIDMHVKPYFEYLEKIDLKNTFTKIYKTKDLNKVKYFIEKNLNCKIPSGLNTLNVSHNKYNVGKENKKKLQEIYYNDFKLF